MLAKQGLISGTLIILVFLFGYPSTQADAGVCCWTEYARTIRNVHTFFECNIGSQIIMCEMECEYAALFTIECEECSFYNDCDNYYTTCVYSNCDHMTAQCQNLLCLDFMDNYTEEQMCMDWCVYCD